MLSKSLTTAVAASLLWVGLVPAQSSAATPTQRIEVQPLGYRPPGSLYLLSDRVFSTLHFIDDEHLLFTFHQSRLMKRETDSAKKDADQTIRALTLKLPNGTVEASAEWRMHDRSRYLWALGDGKFLVRQRNSYHLTDAALALKPWVEVSTPVMATEVSPDGHTLAIEHEFERHTRDEHDRLQAQAEKFGDAPPGEDTVITLVDTVSRHVLGELRTQAPIHLPVTVDGYVGIEGDKRDDQFLVSFYPFQGKTLLLGRVASSCTPHENFLNADALMIESCGPKSSDTYLDVWSTSGKKLWTGLREGHLVWPTFAPAISGRRFAVGLLRVSHPINLADELNDEDVREQIVQVYESATGNLLLTTPASPVLSAGQNFALSADGQRLAILSHGAIEIYDVPSTPLPSKASAKADRRNKPIP